MARGFQVSYFCTRCCDCPEFRDRYDERPYCCDMNAPGKIEYDGGLDNDYLSDIHPDCPKQLSGQP